MVLLSQAGREGERTIAPPPPSSPVYPAIDRGWTDWGIALGFAAYVGSKVWGLFSKQQSAESDMQQRLILAVLDQNKLLIEALIKRP